MSETKIILRPGLAALALCAGLMAGAARAAEPAGAEMPPAPAEATTASGLSASPSIVVPPAEAGDAADNARTWCTNIADAAADARYRRQAAALEELEKNVDARIDALEAKRAEFEQWLTRREEFLRKADDSVVAIFTQMRPDAASQQMARMGLDAAAAILVKLNPRIASAILSEMDPTKAAQLTTSMAGLADPDEMGETSG